MFPTKDLPFRAVFRLFLFVVVCLSAFALHPAPTQAAGTPLIGAIRWDAWLQGNDDNTRGWVGSSLYTTYSYRQPFYGWYTIGVPNHAAIIDQEIDYASSHHLDYWAFDWYPEQGEAEAVIQGPFNDYMASSKHNQMKFAFIVQSYWGNYLGKWDSVYVPYFVNHFRDSQYVMMNGNRPLVYLFAASGFTAAQLQSLTNATTAAGLGAPYYVENTGDSGAATALGLPALSFYGDGQQSPGSGHQCWSAQVSKDTSRFGAYGSLLTVASLTAVDDPRPRDDTPGIHNYHYGFWVDEPTYGQWEAHLKNAYDWLNNNASKATNPPLILIYAWNEIDEGGGGIVPTIQNGTKFLDAINAVKTGTYPNTYTDTLNGDNCSVALSGTWTHYTATTQGNWNNDEELSDVTGSAATLQWVNSTGFTFYGTKGPNRGILEAFVDNVSQGTFDTYNASWQQKQALFTVQNLSAGTHTVKIVVAGQKNGASSGYQIGLDSVSVNVSRSGSGGGSTSFVTGVTSAGRLRNDFSGFVGTEVTVGSTALTVSDLGRAMIAGNSGTHTVEIVRASDGAALGSVSVNMGSGTADALGFKYGTLATPITLAANTSYYFVTNETNGGDQWHDNVNTTLTTQAVGTIPAAVYANGGAWVTTTSGQAYGPVNFKYTVSGGTLSIDDNVIGMGQNQWYYVGNWSYSTTCGDCYNGTAHWDGNPSDYVTIPFTGTQIALYGVVDTSHGQGAVSIDGGAETTVNFNGSPRVGNTILWTSPVLSSGAHTFKLRPASGAPVPDRVVIYP